MELAGHGLHSAGPGEALYVPASHAVHVPPLGPEHPGLQAQFEMLVLPSGELEFAGQGVILAPTTASSIEQKLPIGHFFQVSPGDSE